MFLGWSRRNSPQAKVLTTVPRAAWHRGVMSHTVSLGNQAISCRGGPKASNKEEEWVEVPNKKDPGRRKERSLPKHSRPRPEAVLIKPAEGTSYASILRKLKNHVNPDELGATVQGIREMRSKDLLVELKRSTKSRGRLDIAFKEVIGARGTVRPISSPGSRSLIWNQPSKRKTSRMPSEASPIKNRSWS